MIRCVNYRHVNFEFLFTELVLLDLVGGQVGCKGLLIYRPTTTERFGVACDLDVGNNEAQVICRELGCNPVGATRATATT